MARNSTGQPQTNSKVVALRYKASRKSGLNDFPSDNVDEGAPGPRLRSQRTPGREAVDVLDNPKDKTYVPDDRTDGDAGDGDSDSGPDETPHQKVKSRTPLNRQSQMGKKVQQESTQRKRAPNYEQSMSSDENDTIVVNTNATRQPKLCNPAESKARLKGARQEYALSMDADLAQYYISIFNEISAGRHVEKISFQGDDIGTVIRTISAGYHNSSTSKQDRNHWLLWVKLTDRQRNRDYHNSFDMFQREMRGGEETDGPQPLKRKRETKAKGKNKKQRL